MTEKAISLDFTEFNAPLNSGYSHLIFSIVYLFTIPQFLLTLSMILKSPQVLIIRGGFFGHIPTGFWTGFLHAYRKTKEPYYFATPKLHPLAWISRTQFCLVKRPQSLSAIL